MASMLAERLQTLEDERAILRVLHDYGDHIDYGRDAAWLDLFTQEAVYELRYRPGLEPRDIGVPDRQGNHLIYEGHTMLAAFIAAHSSAPGAYHKHLVTGARIDVAGDAAHARSYFLRVDEVAAAPVVISAGRYLDDLVREGERWRFSRRIAEIEARRPSS